MIEHLLFYGFALLCIVYGVINIVVKIILKRNGFTVPFLNTNFSDYKSLHSLAKKEKKYMIYYYIFVMMTVLPFLFIIGLMYIFLKK